MTAQFPSTAFATVEQSNGTRPSMSGQWRDLWLAVGLIVCVTFVRLSETVDSDVAWQLWIAQRVHGGAKLYTDIIELNPPLWFWMAYPIERLASLLQLRIEPVLIVALGLATTASVTATSRLLPPMAALRRTLFLAYAALVLMVMPWVHVGQREQIVLIATLPYAALLAARKQRRDIPTTTAILIGIGAGLGFALKHYFLVVPVVMELWLLAGLRKYWRPLRPENLAIAAVGIAYAICAILFARDFLSNIVPLARLAYGVTGAPSLQYMLGPYALTAFVAIGFTLVHSRLLLADRAPLASALLTAAWAFAAVYFIQFKGWPYHAIPMLGLASLSIAALLAETENAPSPLRVGGPVLLSFPFLLAGDERAHVSLPSPDLISAVGDTQPRETVAFLAVEPAIPWSITLQRDLRFPSRYMGYWMMRAIVANERRDSPDIRLARLGRQVVSDTVSDYLCMPPRLIVVAGTRWGGDNFDILAFFERDPRFRSLFAHYRLQRRSTFDTYALTKALPHPAFPCRQGV